MTICLQEHVKINFYLVFLDFQDSKARIKIHHFFKEQIYSIRGVSLEQSIEDFKLVVVEKYKFESPDAIINNNFFWYFRPVANRKQKKQRHRH